ncbi:hypothetical protein niasHT_010927 [Heterodera trifolii]|uniref:Chromo domain-containing protein n=1 Tax=Heterodera trifolii TaxID=157864 RepID=A0ABD2LFX0_9BILA
MSAPNAALQIHLYKNLLKPDTGEINVENAKNKLTSLLKKRKLDATSKNLLYNQELRRFLKLRKEIEDKPVKVELTDGSLMVFNPKQREKNRKIPTQIVHEDGEEGLDETGSIPTLEDPYATAEESDAEPTTSTPKTRPLIRPMRVGTIYDIKKAKPHRYGIKDDNEEPFDTRFYAEDLAKTRKDAETTYRIERVLKTRTRCGQKEHLVKFHGYKEPEWIKDTDIER